MQRSASLKMPGTLKDIAQELNLSISTVSCALKDGPKVVSPEIRSRVREAASRIGYRPNRIARSLVTGRTHTVGVVPMYVDVDSLLHPYLQLSLNGIFNAANEIEQDVLVFTARDRHRVLASADNLLDGRVDGVIFVSPRPNSPALKVVCESGLPYSVLYEASNGNSFTVDNRAGVRRAIEHLVALGHRHIAHVTGDVALSDGLDRRDAFLEAVAEFDLHTAQDLLIGGNFTRLSGQNAGHAIAAMSPRPSAVLCGNDDIAAGLLQTLKEHRIRCPRDISVIGFDGVTAPEHLKPALTTIRQPAQEMAASALHAVVSSIESGVSVPSRVFQPDLVIRASTAPVKENIQ